MANIMTGILSCMTSSCLVYWPQRMHYAPCQKHCMYVFMAMQVKAGYCCCCRFDTLSAAERVVRADRERQESTLVKVDTH